MRLSGQRCSQQLVWRFANGRIHPVNASHKDRKPGLRVSGPVLQKSPALYRLKSLVNVSLAGHVKTEEIPRGDPKTYHPESAVPS
jgi:hypothetical protein